jgi:hypothetical protein
MEIDEEQILAEVKRRKARAQKSGVITSAFTLYERDLSHQDAWAKNCPDLIHPAIKVLAITEEGDWRRKTRRIETLIRGRRYTFTFERHTTNMPDGGDYTSGNLRLDFEGQHVMTIDCGCQLEDYVGEIWSANDVSAFIEGQWVEELNALFIQVTTLHDVRRKREQEQAKKQEVEKLKRNFGL